jgi:hypothetical protein
MNKGVMVLVMLVVITGVISIYTITKNPSKEVDNWSFEGECVVEDYNWTYVIFGESRNDAIERYLMGYGAESAEKMAEEAKIVIFDSEEYNQLMEAFEEQKCKDGSKAVKVYSSSSPEGVMDGYELNIYYCPSEDRSYIRNICGECVTGFLIYEGFVCKG